MLCRSLSPVLLPFAFAATMGGTVLAEPTETPATTSRVVAIGDIHGALGALSALLRSAGIVDEDDRWIGGTTTLVQNGDFLDRGENAVAVARLLRRLQGEAEAAGGRVEVLLGNHEALNLLHRFDDVTPAIVAPYVDEDSEKRREALCRKQAPRRRREARDLQRRDRSVEIPSKVVAFNRCIRDHPLGMVEYVEDLGPDGDLGGWIRTLPALVRLDDVLFLHGGISATFATWKLEDVAAEVRLELERWDLARKWMEDRGLILATDSLERIVSTARALVDGSGGGTPVPDAIRRVARLEEWLLAREDGPLWFRGYAQWSDEEGPARLEAILEPLGIERVVVGHTPMPGGEIQLRFDGRVALIDTGMLASAYRGLPTALESTPGCLAELRVGARVPLRGCESPEPAPPPP